jgi:hypothetical protein
VVKAARELWKDKGWGMIKSAEWSESDELLMFRGKIYVPKDRELRHCIVKQHYNTYVAGHAGHFKTFRMYHKTTGGHKCLNTSESMWWPVIYAIKPSYSTIDPLENSIPLRLWKSDGM